MIDSGQHPRYNPFGAGQQSPPRFNLAHDGIAEHFAGLFGGGVVVMPAGGAVTKLWVVHDAGVVGGEVVGSVDGFAQTAS